MTGETLPHVCPHCGERFGWGPEAALLTICDSVPFDEPSPCCGERLVGKLVDGVIEWGETNERLEFVTGAKQ